MSHQIVFSIPDDLAGRLVEVTGRTPTDMARDYLLGYFEDGRNQKFSRQRITLAWHQDVYAGIIRHVGRGAAADWIRRTVYSKIGKGTVLTAPPKWLPSRIENSKSPKIVVLTPGAGRKSINIPLILPTDWVVWLKENYPENFSMPIKAWCQQRLEKETGRLFPVQRGMSDIVGHD